MLVPITKAFWRGKVGTRVSGAYDATIPITSVPITNIFCISFMHFSAQTGMLSEVYQTDKIDCCLIGHFD